MKMAFLVNTLEVTHQQASFWNHVFLFFLTTPQTHAVKLKECARKEYKQNFCIKWYCRIMQPNNVGLYLGGEVDINVLNWLGGTEAFSHLTHFNISAFQQIFVVSAPLTHSPLAFQAHQPGMCGAEYFPPGRGEDKNPRGGAGWGGAKERVNQLIQKFDKCEYLELLWRYL